MKPLREDKTRCLDDFTEDELFIIIDLGYDLTNYVDFTPWSAAHHNLMNFTNRTSLTDEENKLFNQIFRKVALKKGYKEEEINYSWTDRWGIIENPYQ